MARGDIYNRPVHCTVRLEAVWRVHVPLARCLVPSIKAFMRAVPLAGVCKGFYSPQKNRHSPGYHAKLVWHGFEQVEPEECWPEW